MLLAGNGQWKSIDDPSVTLTGFQPRYRDTGPIQYRFCAFIDDSGAWFYDKCYTKLKIPGIGCMVEKLK